MTLYLISGLGADKRVFSRLIFPDTVVVVYIDWHEPLPDESLKNYCSRLSQVIDTSVEFIIIGLSFGGIIATELSRIVKPKEVILISSVSTKRELPPVYRLAGYFGLYKILPMRFLKTPSGFKYWFFGAKTKNEKRLLQQILADTSTSLLKWAVSRILTWENNERPPHLFHIHGVADKILPFRHTKADAKINGGEHLMVYSKADLINPLLLKRICLY